MAQNDKSWSYLRHAVLAVYATRQRGVGLLGVAMLLSFVLVACGGGGTQTGDAATGANLFSGASPIAGGNAPVCADCHSIEPGAISTIGPNLSNIGNRAGTTVAGMPATDYLREAIIDPDAFLAGGFQEGIHPRGYGTTLTRRQIDDLIAYMLTLRSGQDS